MKLKVTNGSQSLEYECSEPMEQFIGNGRKRWTLAFCIHENMTAEATELIFCPENMEALIFETDDGATAWTMSGYTHLNSAVIRRSSDGSTSVEIQAIKYSEEAANE